MRRAAKRDTTEPAIILALRQAGALVMQLNKFDLLIYHRRTLFMLDAKTGKRGATKSQKRLIAEGWPLCYVRSVSEALALVGENV